MSVAIVRKSLKYKKPKPFHPSDLPGLVSHIDFGGESLTYDRILSVREIETVNSYLIDRWGGVNRNEVRFNWQHIPRTPTVIGDSV